MTAVHRPRRFTHRSSSEGPTSPVDAGDNTDAPEFDQRGAGFPRIVNSVIDIGAYETQKHRPAPGAVRIDAQAVLPLPPQPLPQVRTVSTSDPRQPGPLPPPRRTEPLAGQAADPETGALTRIARQTRDAVFEGLRWDVPPLPLGR